MRPSDVTVLVHLQLLPEFVDQGKRELLEFSRIVKKDEPDCSAIEIAQDMDDPTRITMIEKWSSREAYLGPHLQTKHMRAFVDRAGGYFEGPPQISFCRPSIIGQQQSRLASPYGR